MIRNVRTRDIPIADCVDILMNKLFARAYSTPERTDTNSTALEYGGIERSNRRSEDSMKADGESYVANLFSFTEEDYAAYSERYMVHQDSLCCTVPY